MKMVIKFAIYLLVVFMGTVFVNVSNAAPEFKQLLSFDWTNGANPLCAMVKGNDGDFYGTTPSGGQWDVGTVFKLNRSGHLTTLFSFDVTNGLDPESGLTKGNDGNFYGTTTFAGFEYEDGSIFKITPHGQFTHLLFFDGINGGYPNGLLLGKDGSLYGTTQWGLSGYGEYGPYGTVFRFDQNSGNLTTLHQFDGSDGWSPMDSLIQDEEGNLYGTSEYGGEMQAGTVFKIAPDGTLVWSFAFDVTNGFSPIGKLVQGSDGNIYGLTAYGGPDWLGAGGGTVFKITSDGVLTNIYSFGQLEYYPNTNSDGSLPTSLIFGKDGYLYGATATGGKNGAGTIFRMNTDGTLTTLYSFGTLTNADGTPLDGEDLKYLVQDDRTGDFYGTAYGGGQYYDAVGQEGLGTVFRLSIVKPEVSITWPCQFGVVTNSEFTVSGKTRGKDMTGVFYQLNGGGWTAATTTDDWLHWTANVTLSHGVNVVMAYAVDSFDDTSRTVSIRFFFRDDAR